MAAVSRSIGNKYIDLGIYTMIANAFLAPSYIDLACSFLVGVIDNGSIHA